MRSGDRQTLDDQLPSAAQEALDALRATFDERVDALEQALGNPHQAASLNTLVLELARVATDEADAAARQACLEAHLDAERSAAATTAQDRQTIAALRQAIDAAKIDLNGARADLDRERHRADAAERAVLRAEQEATATTDSRVREAEARALAADSRAAQASAGLEEADARAAEAESRAAEDADRLHELDLERGELLGVQKQLTVQLERAKATITDLTASADSWGDQVAQAQRDADKRVNEQQKLRQRAEQTLHEAHAAAASAAAARDAAVAERDKAASARDAALAETDSLRRERDGSREERDAARAARDVAFGERDAAVGERDRLRAAHETASAERDSARNALDAARSAAEAASRERDAARAARDAAAREADTFRATRDAVAAERDALRAACEAAERERDDARMGRQAAGAELDAAHTARSAADAAREALTAELAALKQLLAVKDRESSSQRTSSESDRQRIDQAVRQAESQVQSVIQERDQLAGRIQALQEAVKTRDQDWTAKVRGLEQKLRAAEEATRAAAAAAKPAEPATPIAPKPAAAKASTGKTAAPAKRPALPLISRKVVERERPRPVRADPPSVSEAPIEREMPSVGDAVAAAGELSDGPESGVFSTVADALRAWSTEPSAGDHQEPDGRRPRGGSAIVQPPPQSFEDARRSVRYDVGGRDIRAQIDGEAAQIVDLSDNGAQIVTSVMLKPGRHLKIGFPSIGLTATAKGRIIWSRLEPPTAGHGVLTYRAGVAFTSIDPETIQRLLRGDKA